MLPDVRRAPPIKRLLLVIAIGAFSTVGVTAAILGAEGASTNDWVILFYLIPVFAAGCALPVGMAYGAFSSFGASLSWRQCFHGSIAVVVCVLVAVLFPYFNYSRDAPLLILLTLVAAAGIAIGYEALLRSRYFQPPGN